MQPVLEEGSNGILMIFCIATEQRIEPFDSTNALPADGLTGKPVMMGIWDAFQQSRQMV
jgi:hypothetical protein